MLNLLSIAVIASTRSTSVSGHITFLNGKPAVQAIVILSGDEKSSPVEKAVIDQRDRTFSPHVSVVTVGTRVDFPNNDVVFHNVFTEFHSTRFDLGMYPKGTSKHQVFTRPGLAVIMCSIHPEMSAYVMVVDTPYYAITDKTGAYKITNVPTGHYKVDVWHESGCKASQSESFGEGARLDISIKR